MFETTRFFPWALGLYVVWLVAGAVDFHLHRRSNLPMTSGLTESALHGAQLACVGLGVLAWLSLAPSRSVGATALVLAVVHVVMAYADTASADGCRRVTPLEQHVHSVLDACPWIFAVAVVVSSEPGWRVEWQPRPLAVWAALLVPTVPFVLVPWLIEFAAALKWRSIRRAAS